jgi:hypothetical protein
MGQVPQQILVVAVVVVLIMLPHLLPLVVMVAVDLQSLDGQDQQLEHQQ